MINEEAGEIEFFSHVHLGDIRLGYKRNLEEKRAYVMSLMRRLTVLLHWTKVERGGNLGASGDRRKRKTRLRLVAWVVGRWWLPVHPHFCLHLGSCWVEGSI